MKSLGEREKSYDPTKMPKLFTEAYDPKKDSIEAELDKLDKIAFPKYHENLRMEEESERL